MKNPVDSPTECGDTVATVAGYSEGVIEMAKKAKQYFSLLTKTDGVWSVQFGDYDRECVEQERDDSYSDEKCRIIKTDDTQAAIDAAVAKLNAV
ncbi:hypothetical protein Shy_CDS0037 [Escherichia phage Shy]|nr:hypothetical protein Shy_CDS0037 [Escherichia phage Shy]